MFGRAKFLPLVIGRFFQFFGIRPGAIVDVEVGFRERRLGYAYAATGPDPSYVVSVLLPIVPRRKRSTA